MATERSRRVGSGAAMAVAGEGLGPALSAVRLAIALVDLESMTIRAISEAGSELLGRPAEEIVGRRVAEVLDPGDRERALTALEALRSGAIEFYRAHRAGVTTAAPQTGLCAWVRRFELDGRPYAFVRWVDPRVPPGPWPSGADIFTNAVALAVTDAQGIARTAAVCPAAVGDFTADGVVGQLIVPVGHVDNLVTLADWRAARIDGVSIAHPVALPNRSDQVEEFEAIATAVAGAQGWLVVLMRPEPKANAREAELERHLWRIAAEVEASGILMRARATPGLSLARIPEAAALTPRQWDVLRRIVAGERVPTIASELYVSQSTVRNHLSAIFQRFGVHSQAELVAHLAATDASPG